MKKQLTFIACLLTAVVLNAQQWTASPVFPGDERDGIFSFVINDQAYVGGGITRHDFYRYNPIANKWDTLNTVANDSDRCFAAAFAVSGMGYVIGGDPAFGQSMKDVWEYNPATDMWTQKNDFPGGNRVGMLVLQIGNRVFVGGGCESFGSGGVVNAKKDFYEYNAATDSWTPLADLPYEAAFPSGFVIDGKGYLVFGEDNSSVYHNELYCLDTTNMQWTQKQAFPGDARSAGVAFTLNGKGYAGLGQEDLLANYQDFYAYTPASDSWKQMHDYPEAETGWSVAWVVDNTAYVGTGLDLSTFNFNNKIFVFDPTATGVGEWAEAAPNVYPNPFTSRVYLQGDDIPQEIKITDITGKNMGIFPVINSGVNTAHLPPGIYFMEYGNWVVKLVKE